MKIRLLNPALVLLLLILSLCGIASAQVSKSKNKSSNAYRGSYLRFATGSISTSNFEIRGGTLWAWGDNSQGQLGDGTTTQRNSPVQIGSDNKWVSTATGGYHTIALKSDGTLWAWGGNFSGQLGDGTTTSRTSPIQVGTDINWVSIACGGYNTIALKSNGTLWTWGDNVYGQLGDGTTTNRNTPTQVATDTTWVGIAGGWYTNLAHKSNGTLWGWGRNIGGELGDGTATQRTSPTQVGTDTKWVSVACGLEHTIALKSNGTLWGWGYNGQGQVGDGTGSGFRLNPVQLGTDTKWVGVTCGGNHAMALKSEGTLWAWGYNVYGQLGDGTTTNRSAPTQIGTDTKWVGVAGGDYHTTALKSDGTLWAWGRNGEGELGDGTTTDKIIPTQTRTAAAEWVKHARGSFHSSGIKSDGTLWAWGFNAYGQLGEGTNNNRTSPIQIGIDNKWVSIGPGRYHTIALKSDGTLWTWGYNAHGELGDGTTTDRATPTQIGTDTKWVSIACGGYHTVALKSDGTLWAWGWNFISQLGDGTTTDRAAPTQIGTDTKWVSIAGGFLYTVALKSDGTLWTWGDNTYGQLGDGSTTALASPTQIGTDIKWASIACGDYHTIALKSDGTFWAWGRNSYGQLGDGSTTDRTSPIQIGTDNKWVSTAGGFLYTLALKSDGGLWAWGDNVFGQLGDGTTTQRLSPTQIAAQTNVVAVGSGYTGTHSGIIRSTRDKICMTGYNSDGELGDGTTTNASSYNCNNNICASYSLPTTASTSYSQTLSGTGNRTDFRSGCALGCSMTPSGVSAASGTANATILNDASVQSYGSHAYVQRHYDILPATNSNTATAVVTLYFTQAEFSAYNAANGSDPDLPTGPADATGIANLRVTQFHGTPTAGYNPANYPASWGGVGPVHVLINPADAAIIWNSRDNRWEVSFDVIGFSGFFVTGGGGGPLPLTLLSFTAQRVSDHRNRISWATASESPHGTFEVTRSSDGRTFVSLGSVPARGTASEYAFYDEDPLAPISYYRLKTIAGSGDATYSDIAIVVGGSTDKDWISIAPVPASQLVTITNTDASFNGTTAIVTDMQGREMYRLTLNAAASIDIRTWPSGIYMLRLTGGKVVRMVKD